MFATLVLLEKAASTSLAINPLYEEVPASYRGIKGEYVLSSQKEVDRYRVCSGDNFTEFGPWIGFVAGYNEPWRGFVAVSNNVDYTPYKNCTMFEFS
jgi:hypothetical protein